MPVFPDFQKQSCSFYFLRSFLKKTMHFLMLFFCIAGIAFCCLLAVRFYDLTRQNTPPSLSPNTILRFNLDTPVYETRPTDLIGSITFGNPPTTVDIISGLNKAAKDPNISVLLTYMTRTPLSLTQIQEIRAAVQNFKKNGKKTVFYAPSIGEMGGGLGMYYLASAFDEIYIQPGSEVGLAGFFIENLYFKNALLKLGIKPSFNARYEYKTGASSLNSEKMSIPEKENLTSVLNSFLDVMAEDISKDRNLKTDQVKQILQNGPYFADQALKMKLIDGIEYADTLEERLKENTSDVIDLFNYISTKKTAVRQKEAIIAYIPAVGIIQSGESIFGGDIYRSILGSSSFSSILREAADNEKVKAIVIRLDSPGGGYIPSDAIRREIEYIKSASAKPVICSMGSTAASGGYFISLGCDYVFANPSTLTGSIGVFGGKLIFKDLLDKLDINIDTLEFGKNAGLLSMTQDFNKEQKKFFNESLDRIYQDFTEKVAARRIFSPKQIDAVARGRVFTGIQAQKNGLIDQTGGLSDAFEYAANAAKLDKIPDIVEFPINPTRIELLIRFLNSDMAVKIRKSISSQGIIPTFKTWLDTLLTSDMRLFYCGVSAF